MVSSRVNDKIVLFELQMRPKQIQPLQVRVDMGVMAMKVYSTFPKTSEL